MSARVSLIQGKGDWNADPPTGASDGDLYHILNDFFEDGGVVQPDAGNAIVTESDTPGMSVKVAAGVIYVKNSSWVANSHEPKFYRVTRDDEKVDIAISSNPSGSTRIDLVSQSVDKVTTPNDDGSNVVPIVVTEGTPGGGTPTTPADHEVLARITVPDGATTITNTNITDVRREIFARPGTTNTRFKVLSGEANITINSEYGKYQKFFVEGLDADRNVTIINAPEGLPLEIIFQQNAIAGHTPQFTNNVLYSPEGETPEYSTDSAALDVLILQKLPNGDYLATVAASGAQ